jgi:uncharacterized membrane protein required for colicin V production
VDVVEFIQGLNLFDILAAFFVAAFFVLGYMQGAIRRLLGLGLTLVSLLLGLNLRDPLGAWLSQYWSHLPPAYVEMLAFGGSFVVIYLAGSITIQTFYRRTTIFARASAVDELVGGVLGVVQSLLLIATLILVLDSYYALPGLAPNPNEIGLLRSIFELYDPSQTAALMRSSLIPLFFALFGWIVPAELSGRYP